MKDTFFRSMTWLHTWAGLLVCWVLLLVFFAGTLSYFRHEISLWSKPELQQNAYQAYDQLDIEKTVHDGQIYLSQTAPNAQRWLITLPTERKPYASYSWQDMPEKGQRRGKVTEHVLTRDGKLIHDIRESKGGDFFYRLHFDLYYISPLTARYIVGFCTVFMLIALISGIVIHKRIFKDFFSFRPNKGARSWLDFHNLSSVMALPYHLMITYTGLITLMFMYMPWAIQSQYQGDQRAFTQDINPMRQIVKPANEAAPLFMASSLLPQVMQHWQQQPLRQVVISTPNDKNSEISFYLNTGTKITDETEQMVFNGVTGDLKRQSSDSHSGAQATYDTLMSLHTARFSDWALRGLFFICGLLGCAMIATGTLMWALKIRQKQQKSLAAGNKPSLGLRLVEGLNFSTILGLPLATIGFFYANRLLPTQLANRAEWEVNCFFIGLTLTAIIAIKWRERAHWRAMLKIIASLYFALPIVSLLVSQSARVSSWPSPQQVFDIDLQHINLLHVGNATIFGVNLMLVIFGGLFWVAAHKMRPAKMNKKATVRAPKIPMRNHDATIQGGQ